MTSDLTERLAAKLVRAGVPSEASVRETVRVFYAASGDTTIPEVRDEMMRAQIAADAGLLLPLLLSEPELVAKLPDEVRRSVLSARERAVMKLGEAGVRCAEAYSATVNCYTVFGSPEECEAFYAKVGYTEAEATAVEKASHDAHLTYVAALAEAKALTPEGKDG